jgi:hypothetical protein
VSYGGRLVKEDYRVEIVNGGLLAILREARVGLYGRIGFCPLRMSEVLGQEQHTVGCKQRQSHSGHRQYSAPHKRPFH